jgi:hypothetical protein
MAGGLVDGVVAGTAAGVPLAETGSLVTSTGVATGGGPDSGAGTVVGEAALRRDAETEWSHPESASAAPVTM